MQEARLCSVAILSLCFGCVRLQVASMLREKGKFLTPSLSVPDSLAVLPVHQKKFNPDATRLIFFSISMCLRPV
jgi:hypothetical protein